MKKVITILLLFTVFACKKEESEEMFSCQQCLITTSKSYTTNNCGEHFSSLTTQSKIDGSIERYNKVITYPDGVTREYRMSCSQIK